MLSRSDRCLSHLRRKRLVASPSRRRAQARPSVLDCPVPVLVSRFRFPAEKSSGLKGRLRRCRNCRPAAFRSILRQRRKLHEAVGGSFTSFFPQWQAVPPAPQASPGFFFKRRAAPSVLSSADRKPPRVANELVVIPVLREKSRRRRQKPRPWATSKSPRLPAPSCAIERLSRSRTPDEQVLSAHFLGPSVRHAWRPSTTSSDPDRSGTLFIDPRSLHCDSRPVSESISR